MKMIIGIPAFNEEKTIEKVIKSLPKRLNGLDKIDILVLDDGSTDNTEKKLKKTEVLVLRHLINRGLGGAIKTIFAYAKGMQYDLLVTFDADGQHEAGSVAKLIAPILERKKDVVVGSRWLKEKKPRLRYIVNMMANYLTYFLYGVKTSDSQSGLRAFSKLAINSIKLTTDGMEVSSEIFKEINRHKLRYCEVPIKAIYTDYSLSKGQKLSNAVNILVRLLIKLLS